MLTVEQKNENQIKYFELLSKLDIDLTELTKYLLYINFFDKPASSQYCRAYDGGLCEHALKLCHELGVLVNAYCPGKYTAADVIKVALFKDIYRAEMYELSTKNVKNDITGQWETVPYYRTKDGVNRPTFGDLGLSSYMIAKHFIDFTDEQSMAIIHANGLNNFSSDIHDVMKSYQLVTLTKMAELAITYLEV